MKTEKFNDIPFNDTWIVLSEDRTKLAIYAELGIDTTAADTLLDYLLATSPKGVKIIRMLADLVHALRNLPCRCTRQWDANQRKLDGNDYRITSQCASCKALADYEQIGGYNVGVPQADSAGKCEAAACNCGPD